MVPTAIWIDKFKVIRLLGRGGMGAVYEGYDPSLDRRVAIKTLTSDAFVEQDSRNRFEREARAAAKLQHPNIVTIYELGNFGRKEKPYIVMEYLDGADVAALIEDDKGLPLGEALDIAIQLGRGLAFAHEHGVVHRDVKPSNLRYLDDGRLKIMDFGIARVEGSAQITRSGVMVGTLHYMSPEQIQGDPVDGRSDVFSAGCILYETLAGKRPFGGETATSILYKIIHEEPVPILQVNPELPQEIQDILRKALAKKPAERFATAEEMAREIEKLQSIFRKSFLRPPPAVESQLSSLSALTKERRWADVLSAADRLLKERPELEEPRRVRRLALRNLRQEEVERRTTDEEKTKHIEEISDEFKKLYGPAFEPTVADQGRVETRFMSHPPTPAPSAGELLLRSKTAVQKEKPARSLVPVIGAVTAALALVIGLFWWRTSGPTVVTAPAPLAYELRVTTNPLGAAIFVNGVDTGLLTEARVPLKGRRGDAFTFELRLSGFESATRQVALAAEAPGPLDVVLQAIAQKATLTSEPKGAQVTVDGTLLEGTTPLALTLSPDREHTVVVSKEGYSSRTVKLSRGEALPEKTVLLSPLGKPGTLVVETSYPVAILSAGKTVAESSTSPRAQLRAGEHVVTLYAPDKFLNREVRVVLAEGGTEVIQSPALGKLALKAEPSNCRIMIDGIRSDEPPPYFNKDIVEGRHRLDFEWPDGSRQSVTKEVAPGKMTYVTVKK